MSKHSEIRKKYLALFPAEEVDRNTISCPECKTGKNSGSGNARCFHCNNCGLTECEVTSPALDE